MPSDLIQRPRLKALLDGARNCHIVVVGDAMLDVYLRGDVDRISPEAPVPVVRVRDRKFALGGAANVAQNVVALGGRPTLVAAVGKDIAATQLRDALRGIGASIAGLVEVARPTTTKTRVVARAQQLLRVDEEHDGDLSSADVERLATAAEQAIASADALVLEDYNKGVLVTALITRVMRAAKAKKIPIVVDPKYRNFFSYSGATVFKPNRRELESALGAAVDVDHPETLPAVVERLGAESLLLTLSERGMALIERGAGVSKGVHRIPTTAREVYDVVGAGDTVTAYLAAMLAAGATPLEAAIVANFAAGVEVGKSGAATVSGNEVLAAFDEHRAEG
jgi:D-beta-D-heptose 7-phosphate kinase/D-beta-D-heptose 1-phosphate adenosyltransferase